jgi:oligopeptide/dipeptide ABC transporter ATP-binding protein
VLEARGLRVTFPPRGRRGPARAVDGVNLTVGRAEIVALIGESGCGKSSLARAFIGLIKPTAGEVRYEGNRLVYSGSALKEYRRHVRFVLQDPAAALNPRHNVYDSVAEGPRLHGIRSDLNGRVSTALTQAGMRPAEQFFARFPHELSGGQQQRVVIAGALALGPSVIVEVGSVSDVLLAPRHPYTQALVAAVPSTSYAEHAAPLAGEPPDPTAIPRGCRFHPRCPRRAMLGPHDPMAELCLTEVPVLDSGASGQRHVACHLADLADSSGEQP